MRAEGINPFPARFTDRIPVSDARGRGESLEAGASADGGVAIAGRLVARRGHGKTVFADVEDRTGTVQVWATVDRLGEQGLALLGGAHLGDIIGVRGTVVRMRRGEISVAADRVEMLAKALRPPPDRHGGLIDPETRYRQRYLDLMASEDVRAQFVMRARAIAGVRRFLDERGFIEVETPVLQPIYGGAAARPFTTHHNELDRDLYLRIATELYLKRCIVGGLEKVYEIGKDFRNEGVSFKHNPEFTMLETYEAYADYDDVATMLEQMVSAAAIEATGGTTVLWKGREIDLKPPWRRVRLVDALEAVSGINVMAHTDATALRAAMRAAGLDAPGNAPWPKLVDGILSQALEPTLIQPDGVRRRAQRPVITAAWWRIGHGNSGSVSISGRRDTPFPTSCLGRIRLNKTDFHVNTPRSFARRGPTVSEHATTRGPSHAPASRNASRMASRNSVATCTSAGRGSVGSASPRGPVSARTTECPAGTWRAQGLLRVVGGLALAANGGPDNLGLCRHGRRLSAVHLHRVAIAVTDDYQALGEVATQ